MMRRSLESLRRHIKVKQGLGVIPMPVGTFNNLVFHLKKSGSEYLLLNAQTPLIQNKIDYEEIKLVTDYVGSLNREGQCMRKLLVCLLSNMGSLVICFTFLLFFTLLILISTVQGRMFGTAMIVYGSIIFSMVVFVFLGYTLVTQQVHLHRKSPQRIPQSRVLPPQSELRAQKQRRLLQAGQEPPVDRAAPGQRQH